MMVAKSVLSMVASTVASTAYPLVVIRVAWMVALTVERLVD